MNLLHDLYKPPTTTAATETCPSRATRQRHSKSNRPSTLHRIDWRDPSTCSIQLPTRDRLQVWHRVAVTLSAPHCFVGQHVEAKRGVVEAPATIEKRASRNSQWGRNLVTTELPLAQSVRNRHLPGNRDVVIIPLIGLTTVVPREGLRHHAIRIARRTTTDPLQQAYVGGAVG